MKAKAMFEASSDETSASKDCDSQRVTLVTEAFVERVLRVQSDSVGSNKVLVCFFQLTAGRRDPRYRSLCVRPSVKAKRHHSTAKTALMATTGLPSLDLNCRSIAIDPFL
jgi:hypothetical protein